MDCNNILNHIDLSKDSSPNSVEDLEIVDLEELRSIPIEESITSQEIDEFKPFNLRYYDDRYCVSFNKDHSNSDILLRIHTNKLMLLTIAKGHDIFRKDLEIESINFSVKNRNTANIKLKGKRKAGAQKFKSNSILCYLKCKNESEEFPIYVGLPSSLIEINDAVVKEPNLLKTDYKGLGYIGILYPSLADKNTPNNLLSEEEYVKYMESRLDT